MTARLLQCPSSSISYKPIASLHGFHANWWLADHHANHVLALRTADRLIMRLLAVKNFGTLGQALLSVTIGSPTVRADPY